LATSSTKVDELIMVAILLILFIVLLFAALPTWPYSASGRARYHVVSVGERTVRPAKRPQVLSRETPPYAAQFRKLQNELQKALDRAADASPKAPNVREADLSRSRQKRAA
jgi:Protein of unknown function (DUF3309)